MNRGEEQKAESPKSARQTYNRPQLQVYGDLREVTQAVGNTSLHSDGGNPNPGHANKTH